MTRAGTWIVILIGVAVLSGLAWLMGQDGDFPWGGWVLGILGIVVGALRPQWLERRWPKKARKEPTSSHPSTDDRS